MSGRPLPPAGPSSTLPRAGAPFWLQWFLLIGAISVAWIVWIALSSPDMPRTATPQRSDREAQLQAEVAYLTDLIVILEQRNAATLDALAGFEAVPTSTPQPTPNYVGPH